MENFNFDFEKLQQQEVVTFIDKHDLNAILDALECRDEVSKKMFTKKYSQEYITSLIDTLLGKFTEYKGKTMLVSNALVSTATTSILLLPFIPEEEFNKLPEKQIEQLNQSYEILIQFYNLVKDNFKL